MNLNIQAFFIDVFHPYACFDLYSEFHKRAFRLLRQVLRERWEHSRRAVHQNDLCLLGVNRAEIILEGLSRDLCNSSGKLYTCWARSHDDEREPRAPLSGISYPLSDLECVKYLVPDVYGFLYAFQARGPFSP